METIKVGDGTQMQAYAAGLSGVPEKGIIVVQEAFGVNDYIRRMTDRFVATGFLAVAPEMFHRSAAPGTELSYTDYPAVQPHMQALTPEGMAADLKASYDWLVGQGVPEDKIAVLGFCLGGRASFLANAELPLACAVSFYGGGIAQNLLGRAKDLHGPQLLMWGGKDKNILSEHTRALADALREAGKPFVDVTFSDADHAFARDVGDHYDEKATREAWALADAFLAAYLA